MSWEQTKRIAYRRVDLSMSDNQRYYNAGWNALLRLLEEYGMRMREDERYTITDKGRAMLKGGE